MKNTYEHYLRWIFEKKTIPVEESNWEALKKQMHAQGLVQQQIAVSTSRRRSRFLSLVGLLSTLAIGIAFGWGLKKPKIQEVQVVQYRDVSPSSLQSTQVQNTHNTTPNIPTLMTVYVQTSSNSMSARDKSHNVIDNQSITEFSPIGYTPEIETSSKVLPQRKFVYQNTTKQELDTKEDDRLLSEYNRNLQAELAASNQSLVYEQTADHPKMNYGLKGGVFSGSGQSGFTGTLHLERNIDRRFMIESDLGFVNSMGSMGSVVPSISAKNTTNGLTVSSSEAGLSYDNLEAGSRIIRNGRVNYTFSVFNPSAGYRVSDRITAKLGLDFQALLSNSNRTTYINIDDRYYRMARYDFGVTPKINVKLNSRLSGEFVYRNGLNASLLGSEYWNRNYFFAQLNFNLR